MKVIDIFNKIANGEKVRFRLLCDSDIFELDKDCTLYNETQKEVVQWCIDEEWLNKEVEITEDIEEKKIPEKIEKKIPEQINKSYNIRILDFDKNCAIKDYDMEQLIEMVQDIYDKQVDIIDYLKSKGDE